MKTICDGHEYNFNPKTQTLTSNYGTPVAAVKVTPAPESKLQLWRLAAGRHLGEQPIYEVPYINDATPSVCSERNLTLWAAYHYVRLTPNHND